MQNVHPLVVHFPIALLVLAVAAEWVSAVRGHPTLETIARWSLYLGTIAAALAAISGWYAAQTVTEVAAAHDSIAHHQRLGFLTLGTAAVLAFWRFGSAARGGPRPRWLFRLGVLGLGAFLLWTAEEGGELVYEYGVGTELTAPEGPLAEPPSDSGRSGPTGDEFR